MKRTCPACAQRSLTVKRGVGGILVLCSTGCSRDRILAAFDAETPTTTNPTGGMHA